MSYLSAVNSTAASSSERRSPSRYRAYRRIRGALGLIVGIALCWGAYFYFYATGRLNYFSTRTLRVLSTMSAEVDASLRSADTVLGLRARVITKSGDLETGKTTSPLLRHVAWQSVPQKKGAFPRWLSAPLDGCTIMRDTTLIGTKWSQDTAARPSCLYRRYGADRIVVMNLATYLAEIVRHPVAAHVFAKAVLADSAGRVLAQSGMDEVGLLRLDALAPPMARDGKTPVVPSEWWNRIRSRPGYTDVQVAGVTVRLYVSPCCMGRDGPIENRGLVVAGLVNKRSLLLDSLQISPSLLTSIVAVLSILVLCWPLLKLVLLGEGQRVTLGDAISLGAAAILGTGTLTVLVLYFSTDHIYAAGRDAELRRTAQDIEHHLQWEISAARAQLVLLTMDTSAEAKELKRPNLLRNGVNSDTFPFPFFESFAIVDETGLQVRKASTDSFVQTLVSVANRDFIKELKRHHGWTLDSPNTDTFYLQSVRSVTTGKRQAILAIPRKPDSIAMLSLEMLSLIGPIMPVWHEFAVVDERGEVLFHSDPTRNLLENFFLESDGNRELLSAVGARVGRHINLIYGGHDHRAFVQPLKGLPWTLITIREKEPGRTASAEYVGGSLYLLAIYVLGLIAVTLLLHMVWPRSRAAWLWPDPERGGAYRRLTLRLLVMVMAYILILVADAGAALLPVTGFFIVAVILLTWVTLARSGATPESRHASRDYVYAGVFLLLCLSCLPAAGAFKLSFQAEQEMFVKYVQLSLARSIAEYRARMDEKYNEQAGLGKGRLEALRLCSSGSDTLSTCNLGVYHNFFGTEVMGLAGSGRGSGPIDLSSLERVLIPYRAQASVPWRALLASAASDELWTWGRDGQALHFAMRANAGNPPIVLASALPPILPYTFVGWIAFALLLGLVAGVTWILVRTIAHHFFLLDVNDPLPVRKDGVIAHRGDASLLVVCGDTDEEEVAVTKLKNGTDDTIEINVADVCHPLRGCQHAQPGRRVLLRYNYGNASDEDREAVLVLTRLITLARDRVCSVAVTVVRSPETGILGLPHAWQEPVNLSKVLESFVIVRARDWTEKPKQTSAGQQQNTDQLIVDEIAEEMSLQEIWSVMSRSPDNGRIGTGERLELMGDRAESYYEAIWQTCLPVERQVLVGLAETGLPNGKDRKALRRLLARGLICRKPDFRIMNETFRRFLVKKRPKLEAEETEPASSMWDAIRGPLIAVVASAVVVLFVTQQEAFSAANALIIGLSTSVPALMKVLSAVLGRRLDGTGAS